MRSALLWHLAVPVPTAGTILIADDSPDDIFLMRRGLAQARLAHELRVVRDGEQLIDYLSGVGLYSDRAQYPVPTLLFLDIKMPRVNGFEALIWIRAQPQFQHLPVIIFSGSDRLADIRTAYNLGACSFLVKGTDFENLTAIAEGC